MADNSMIVPMLSLDATLDDIELLPSFGMFPTGAYRVLLEKGIQEKTIEKSGLPTGYFFDVQMKLEAPGECDTSSFEFGEAAPNVGDVCNFLFDRQHKGGQSRFSEFTASIAAKFGCKTPRELMEKSVGISMLVVIKREKNKESGRTYGNIKHAAVL